MSKTLYQSLVEFSQASRALRKAYLDLVTPALKPVVLGLDRLTRRHPR
jgi:hypothetical protein